MPDQFSSTSGSGPPHGHSGRLRNSSAIWVLAILLGWEITGRLFEVRTETLPTPSRLIMELLRNSSDLQGHALSTLAATAAGMVIAVAAALPIWLWACFASSPMRAVESSLALVRRFPLAVAAPFFALWWGFGLAAKMLTAALFAFWPLLVRLAAGYRALWPEMADWMRLTGARRARRLQKAYLPAFCYFLEAGLAEAFSMSLSGSLTAEFLGAEDGLGYLLMLGIARTDGPLFATALALILMILAGALSMLRATERLFKRHTRHE